MAGRVEKFSAKDAFTYTDTYRRAIKMDAATIATEKERLIGRARTSGGGNSGYYAELRALEHAMNHLVKGAEPGTVLLGEGEVSEDGESEEEKIARLTAKLAQVQANVKNEEEQKRQLKKDLKAVGDAYSKLQATANELNQMTARLQRKVRTTSSTFGVVTFTMFMVIVALLMVIAK